MSVSLTEDAVRARTKTVTRRVGWLMLKPGDRLTLCRKVMGRRDGEPLVRIVDVELVSVRREPLCYITPDDVTAEGFPDWTCPEFIAFFCRTHKGCTPRTTVTRIEWRYLETGLTPEALDALGIEFVRTSDGAIDANATFLNSLDRLNAIEAEPAARTSTGEVT